MKVSIQNDNLTHELELFESLAAGVPEGVSFINKNKVVIYWNKSAEKLTGFTQVEVINLPCSSGSLPFQKPTGCDACTLDCAVAATMSDGKTREVHTQLQKKDGKMINATLRCLAVKDDSGEIGGVIEVFTEDLKKSPVKTELKRLRHDVITDNLTNIGNRRLANEILEMQGLKSTPCSESFGIIFFDIDNFKSINDRFGHSVGDQVLFNTAQLANNIMRNCDTLCRWGGEEFVALLPNIGFTELLSMAESIRQVIEKSELIVFQKTISYTISVGVALQEQKETANSTLERADSLMYAAKNTGKNRVRY